MANKYANLNGSNLIKDEYTKINTGFDLVEVDFNGLAGVGRTTETVKGNSDALKSHEAENVSHVIEVTRDLSLTGAQVITLPFKAKFLILNAVVTGTLIESNGVWAGGTQRSIYQKASTGKSGGDYYGIVLYTAEYVVAKGSISNVTDTGFTINWAQSGGPTGEARIQVLAITH